MILCNGKLHPITAYRPGSWVCAVLVLSVIICSFYCFIHRDLFHHDFQYHIGTINGIFMVILFILNHTFMLPLTKYFWLCKCATPWMFPTLTLSFNIGLTFELLYVVFTFRTRLFYRGVPGFTIDCPCGVWCRGLTTCLQYNGSLVGNLVWSDGGFVTLTWGGGEQHFLFVLRIS